MNKYNNKKTVIDGITFDSKREANRYMELRQMQRFGEISNLRMQVPYELQPAFALGKKRIRPIRYIADFVYTEKGREVIEDAKGKRTDVYDLKRKMFAYKYGQEIREV